ncbi:MAG: aminotransferase class V-fold PLP-dependent enzyme [Robiginitomaculum sp.]|nr:aminotransferase class V-fold PLP-dependent enzyme [Robiginitomaculum sp.]
MQKFFHQPERYFLSHSVGCQLKTLPDFMQKSYLDPWANAGGNAWPAWLDTLNLFRSELATYLGAVQSDICPQTNVSSALTKVLYSLPARSHRKTILLSPNDFPTIGFALKQAEKFGYKLRFIKGDITDINNWHDAMDDNVQLVHITHAISNTSQLLPVKNICKIAKDMQVFSVVDIAQSVGIVPINLTHWKADFCIGTSVKFLCGGPGACFLYVNPDIIERCEPVDVGWFSHENPFEMDIHNFKFAADALRFWGGTPSPAPFTSALHSLQFWQTPKHNNAPEIAQTHLNQLSKTIPDTVLISPRDASKRGGTLVVSPQKRQPLRSALTAQNIMHDERQEGFRFSIHAYTPQDDVDLLASIFKSVF